MKKKTITITLNKEPREISVSPNELLINVIRVESGLTGTKHACGMGQCGSCTVLINGTPVLSCLTLAVAVDGADITTIEGFEKPDGTLDRLQESFIDNSAIQCGFCTTGVIMNAKAFLEKNKKPTEEQVRELLTGHICRCTGYQQIVDAIMDTASKAR